MRDLDLTSLRLFVAVCDAGNIARAAQEQHIVASAVSKRLAQLEQEVGAELLLRRRRGVIPTAAGETLLENARFMLAGADRIRRDMEAHSGGARGQVRVLAAISAIAEFLPDDIATFLAKPAHRRIQVDIEEGTSKQVVQGVREGRAPVGVCWDIADFEGLQTLPGRSDHLAMAMHPDHPLAARSRLSFVQTLDYEQVGMPAPSAVQVMFQRAAARAGKPLQVRTSVSGFDAALRIVPLTDSWAKRRFAICFRDRETLSAAARLLIDHFAARARREGRA